MTIQAIPVVSHTDAHMVYLVTGNTGHPPELFCGDALFVGGCGRFREHNLGCAEEMMFSLQRFAALPLETLVRCAHEYTLKNLHFLLTEAPGNIALRRKTRWCVKRRTSPGDCFGGLPTVPSTIAEELTYNLFLLACSAEELLRLRGAKNIFEGSGRPDDPDLLALAEEARL